MPFIKSNMAIQDQDKDSIVEIVIGPSAALNPADAVRVLLRPFHDDPDTLIKRSGIPYRGDSCGPTLRRTLPL